MTLLLIVAHASAPLLGALQVRGDLSAAMAQDLSWLAGWVALCALFAVLEPPELTFTPETDVLQTPVCGGTSVGIAAVVGVAHLMTSDWVFDRPFAYARILPAAVLMGAVLLARRQRRMVKLVGLDFAAACAPALYLGLQKETVSRSFGQLEKRGLIRRVDNHRVQLVDLERLRELAGVMDFASPQRLPRS